MVRRSLFARGRVGGVRAVAALAGGALVASVLVPAGPALADTADLPAASSVTVDGQVCGTEPVVVTLDREGSTSLSFGAVFDRAVTGAEVVATDAAGVVRDHWTVQFYGGKLDDSVSASALTDDAVNTLTVRARNEDGTTGPAVECAFLLHRGPSVELSVFPVLGAETVYVPERPRGGVGVPGAFAVAAPKTPDAVSFAYGYTEDLRYEPTWQTVPATENAVIPFVPTSAGEQYLQVAEVDSTGLIGQATSVEVWVAAEGRAGPVPPAVTVVRLGDPLPDDGLAPFRFTLTEDLLPWGSRTGAGQVALYDGTTELARVAFDSRTEDVLVRRSLAGGGHRDLRVEYVQFPGAATLTDTARFCLTLCPFTGGSATVESMWSSGPSAPSYNSAYWAIPEGFSPTPASYTYQWLRDGAAIANATRKTYLSSPADVGRRVSVRITAHGPSMAPRSVTSTPFTVRARDTMHVDYALSWVGSPWESNYCYCIASDGQSAGTPGSGARAQALIARPVSESYVTSPGPSAETEEMPASFWFETEGYVEGRGWVGQKYKTNTPYVGTIGERRRLEAFRIKPGGPHASFYDVWYRAYVPRYGWLGWARNGEISGTSGFGYPLEDVQIRVLPKGKQPAASGTGNAPYYAKGTQKVVRVSPYFRPSGWRSAVLGGSTAGSTSTATSQRLNAVKLSLADAPYSGSIQVSAKVQGDGWRSYVGAGKAAGTADRRDRTSAYKMRLTGEMAQRYDLYYRVHVAGTGWLGWAKNGAGAGTESYGYRNTAVQVMLVKKGERALMSYGGRAAYRR